MNKQLKGYIMARYGNQKECADAMGISVTSLNLKLNNKFGFKQEEIKFLIQELGLSPDNVMECFFKEREE